MYGFFCFNKLLAVFTMIKINKSNFPDIFIKEYAPVIPIRKLKKIALSTKKRRIFMDDLRSEFS